MMVGALGNRSTAAVSQTPAPIFDDGEVDAFVSAAGMARPPSGDPTAPTSVSEEATALTRQLAAQHLEVLAQCAADAVEGRRITSDPRVDRALNQTLRLAREMEDEALVGYLERLRALFARVAVADAADHAIFARRLRDTMLSLGELAGGPAEARLRSICLRRRGLHPLAARLRALSGIGDRRLSKLWEAGLLSTESLIDADPSDLVSAARITRALAVRVIRVANEHAVHRAEAAAELLEEAASEAGDIYAGRGLDDATRERLVRAATATRQRLDRWAPPPLPVASQHLPRCRPLARLGEGGEAEVLRAEYHGAGGIQRMVALKRLLPQHAAVATRRERLLAEGRLLARIDHPHVVTLIDVVHVGQEPQLALELLKGTDLLHLLECCTAARRRLPPSLAAHLAIVVSSALQAIHALEVGGRPLAHGDVSPANVMLTHDARVKLVDLGVAAFQGIAGATQRIRGHAGYIAPETVTSGQITPASDQFALATLVWETMTLRRLFWAGEEVATFKAIAEARVDERFRRHAYVPTELQAILARALQRDPAARYPDSAAFGGALAGWLDATAEKPDHDDLTRFVRELVPVPFEVPLDAPRRAEVGHG
ncbi:MAG: protein kinase [Myxococcota bacterium]